MTERGWAGATIGAIADLAGVATPTVYAAFGNKLGIVEAMRITMLRESKIPELMQQMEGEPDPARRLALWAKLIRQQMESSYDVISIHRQAARADERFAADYRKVLDNRAGNFASVIDNLRDHLAKDLDARAATDILWALPNEELWRELVEERGWSANRYELWLASTLVTQLLAPPAATRWRRAVREKASKQ